MSNSMGIASVFVLSSLLLSPLALAEESPAFVARNAQVAASLQHSQEAYAAQPQDATKAVQQTASKNVTDDQADS
ncbi:hypothetical protein IAE35_22115 [Pseudomonas sp. S75]|uniref:hypothetical protein n=1 Tax=unclassified Pseudomonas TaxID=196821 RepID=UPI001906FA1D|nr:MULTISPECIES: hypothetical protein [unclassified Pseudomonas]MBJ9976281.1 hypothetical protein [Pseudomonas sp. S30]MBK0156044.1 hypothetical protein [Pseudomonas sp. S75]